jgi:hypothetical protein
MNATTNQLMELEQEFVIGTDGFPIDLNGLYAEQHIALDHLLTLILEENHWFINIRSYPEFLVLLKQDDQFQIHMIFAVFEHLEWCCHSVPDYYVSYDNNVRRIILGLSAILQSIFRRKIHCAEVELLTIIRWCAVDCNKEFNTVKSLSYSMPPVRQMINMIGFVLPVAGVFRWIEHYLGTNELTKELDESIQALGALELKKSERAHYNKILLHREKQASFKKIFDFGVGERWADAAVEQIESLPIDRQEVWAKLIVHASTARQSTPSSQWLKTGRPILEEIGIQEFKSFTFQWFGLVEQSLSRVAQFQKMFDDWLESNQSGDYKYREMPTHQDIVADGNKKILAGLIWFCSLIPDDEVLGAIVKLTVQCYKKVPGYGPLCLKAGNAGLWLLSEAGTPAAIDCIEKLRQKVKNGSIQNQIEKALNRASEKAGLSREDLAELAIPNYGLDAAGQLQQTLGSVTATISIVGIQQVTLSWFKADGKQQKTVPAEVKQSFASELKNLKRTADDLKKTLLAQRDRLESFYLIPRTWSFPIWRDRYLDHPVLAQLSRRLVWSFTVGPDVLLGIWHQGKWVDVAGKSLPDFDDACQVALWHPIDSSPETILAWRRWLEAQEVQQPFKQAYREVYILTDAERQTQTYSNRFAAHIIRQHQFANLCQQRGWYYSLQGNFDSYCTPTWHLPQWNLQIQFWVNPVSEEVSESGIFLYLSTDQVRFCKLGTMDPLELATIPKLIFSEVMRNVDLFVGVASVGNNPNWQDQGELNSQGDYWQSYNFGDLGTTAKLRKELLARLLPKLKIGDRCTLEDKFLTVRGELNTYQIHLGSGNIMMQPGSRYLCIVPDSAKPIADRQVFLPFEGDGMLAIILSKAFLLATDKTIKNPSIQSQIHRI